jgi:hypothetical protein
VSRRQSQILFAIAAAWNFAAAAGALLTPELHRSLFFTVDNGVSAMAQINTQGFWVAVLLFGVGYAIVARDPAKNHGLVVVGALGKLYVAVAWSWNFFAGTMKVMPLIGGLGDLVFAGLFLYFLRCGIQDP